MRTCISAALWFAIALAIGGVSGVMAQGNRTPQNDDVLTQLLTEVRGLRAAMEQVASAGPRAQVALGRLQLQEQRIATMHMRLASLRDSIRADDRGAHRSALKAEEAELEQQIAAEQGRWTDINQRLEELERTLGRR